MELPMVVPILLLAFSSPVLAASANDLPQFMWTLCPETSKKYDQCLEVDFPSDRTDDIALLNYVGGERTILKGILMKEGGVHVSVTVEGNILTIIMHSIHDNTHAMYEANVDTASTKLVELPDGIILDNSPASDMMSNKTLDVELSSILKRELSTRFVPATGYRLRCAVFYDETFKAMNGGSTSASETRIRSIFNHVENLYSILTVNGQARSIVPEIVEIRYEAGQRWTADSSLRTVSQISNRLQLEVDEHVYLCFQNNQRGIAGVAYVGGTCSIYQYYRTNINEWITSDANAARIIAHEIGHNLGMLHDFNGGNTNSQRYEGGQLCTNVGGIMDYRSNPYRWSACSVGDFTRYYNRVRNERPNDGYRPTYPFCLQAAEAATTTTTTTTTPETTTTIDASCIATCISSWTAAGTPACVKTTLCTDSCAKGVCT